MNKSVIKTKKVIPLSPNEEKTLRENEEKRKRILRIQQARNQGKKIYENRIPNYNTSVEEELKSLIRLIQAQWNRTHIPKINNFFELKKLTKNYIDAAQMNAKIQRNNKVLKRHENLIKLYEEKVIENEKIVEVKRKQCKETLEKIKGITDYIRNQYDTVTTSNWKDNILIDQYQIKQKKNNGKLENGNNIYMTFKDIKVLQKKNYDGSSYRHINNIILGNSQSNNVFNTTEVDNKKLKESQMNIENNQKKLKESLQITKERYRKAIAKVNDEKQKEIFIRNLKMLERIGKLQKKENINNFFKGSKEQNVYNSNKINFINANRNNYNINYYENDKSLEKIPNVIEKSYKKEPKNVEILSYRNTNWTDFKKNVKELNYKSSNMKRGCRGSSKQNVYGM
jgi:hypothetical protein